MPALAALFIFIGILLGAGLGCDDATGPEPPPIGGAFQLVEFEGEPLPVTIASNGPGCFQQVTHGFLTLEPDFRVFQMEYQTHDSCDGRMLSLVESIGVYGQDGQRIDFTEPAVPEGRPDIVYDGVINGERIVVDFLGVELVFE